MQQQPQWVYLDVSHLRRWHWSPHIPALAEIGQHNSPASGAHIRRWYRAEQRSLGLLCVSQWMGLGYGTATMFQSISCSLTAIALPITHPRILPTLHHPRPLHWLRSVYIIDWVFPPLVSPPYLRHVCSILNWCISLSCQLSLLCESLKYFFS